MSRKPTVVYVEGLAKSILRTYKFLEPTKKKFLEPEKDKDGNIGTLDWLRIRYENIEAWESGKERELAEETWKAAQMVAGEAEAKVSKRNAENASKPRHQMQHPRKDKALSIAANIKKTNPSMSERSVAIRATARMRGDDVPAFDTVARWRREKLRR